MGTKIRWRRWPPIKVLHRPSHGVSSTSAGLTVQIAGKTIVRMFATTAACRISATILGATMMQLQRHSARDSGSTPLLRGMRSEKGRSGVQCQGYCSPALVWTQATRCRRCVMTRIPRMWDCGGLGECNAEMTAWNIQV